MPIKFTFRNSTIKQLIAPFQFQRSKVYYLNNSSHTFKDSFPDSLSTDFITAIESIKYEFIDIAEQQKNTFNRINEVIRYHFPTENQYKLINQQDSENPLSDFLELLEIENHAEHAFIVPLGYSNIVHVYIIQDADNQIEENVNLIINEISEQVKDIFKLGGDDDNYSMRTYFPEDDDDYNLKLDEETKILVNEIIGKLNDINDSGAFLQVLPFLQSQIKNIKEEAEIKLSKLFIAEDYKITLTDYGEIEIKMSHLTKSLYFLFLLKREVHLDELKKHKESLFLIYKHISYQEDFDRMEESVDKLLRNENNEIYIHFSRIKSAFCKVIDQEIAKNYYIVGGKGQPKRIDLGKDYYALDIMSGTLYSTAELDSITQIIQEGLAKIRNKPLDDD